MLVPELLKGTQWYIMQNNIDTHSKLQSRKTFRLCDLACYGKEEIVIQRCYLVKEVLAIRRIFSLVDMITNTKFSSCPNVFKFGVVQQ